MDCDRYRPPRRGLLTPHESRFWPHQTQARFCVFLRLKARHRAVLEVRNLFARSYCVSSYPCSHREISELLSSHLFACLAFSHQMSTIVDSACSSAVVCGGACQRSPPPASLKSPSSRPLPMADIVHPKSPCPPHDDLGVSVGWEASYEGWPVSIRQVLRLAADFSAFS